MANALIYFDGDDDDPRLFALEWITDWPAVVAVTIRGNDAIAFTHPGAQPNRFELDRKWPFGAVIVAPAGPQLLARWAAAAIGAARDQRERDAAECVRLARDVWEASEAARRYVRMRSAG